MASQRSLRSTSDFIKAAFLPHETPEYPSDPKGATFEDAQVTSRRRLKALESDEHSSFCVVRSSTWAYTLFSAAPCDLDDPRWQQYAYDNPMMRRIRIADPRRRENVRQHTFGDVAQCIFQHQKAADDGAV